MKCQPGCDTSWQPRTSNSIQVQRVLSNRLWQSIRSAAKGATQRKAAIAYVTKDLVGFRKGDLLIVDASESVIRAGGTDAKFLSKLARRGVSLYSCPGLHAKVMLLDDRAVIGSGNMSESSQSTLVEAAVLTDAISIVSGVAALIAQLEQQSKRLDKRGLKTLAKIKVARRRFGPARKGAPSKLPKITNLGTRTWLIGVVEYDRKLSKTEQDVTLRAQSELSKKHRVDKAAISWIRWTGKGSFVAKSQPGDRIIQIWRPTSGAKRPSVVLRPRTLLLKNRAEGSTFAFVDDSCQKNSEIPWTSFVKLMKRLGYRRRFGANSEVLLDPELADAINRNWKTA